jgi:uncharacterized protein YoxC
METLTFIHGVLTVIGLLMGVGMVWVIQKIIDLKERLKEVSNELETIERDIHLRVDGESAQINEIVNSIYRDMDSRFDKFENRISEKQLLKG